MELAPKKMLKDTKEIASFQMHMKLSLSLNASKKILGYSEVVIFKNRNSNFVFMVPFSVSRHFNRDDLIRDYKISSCKFGFMFLNLHIFAKLILKIF